MQLAARCQGSVSRSASGCDGQRRDAQRPDLVQPHRHHPLSSSLWGKRYFQLSVTLLVNGVIGVNEGLGLPLIAGFISLRPRQVLTDFEPPFAAWSF